MGTFNKTNNESPRKNFIATAYHEDESTSPGKMIDEQRKKMFYQRKSEMSKKFEVKNSEREELIVLETPSQAMKNSLDIIGDPNPKRNGSIDKIKDFGKPTISKFLEPLTNNSNLIMGKRPCARDGHCSAIIKDELIIFGGDRHQMSFNDIYKLNLQMADKLM
eukprot:GHVR01136396.1.p1 GENE.GHVR01136396.1~~GHVR01136396.1.p1  ORF type:complete len:163 (-),score=7.41 GHVR01136396.1:471-959(-)